MKVMFYSLSVRRMYLFLETAISSGVPILLVLLLILVIIVDNDVFAGFYGDFYVLLFLLNYILICINIDFQFCD